MPGPATPPLAQRAGRRAPPVPLRDGVYPQHWLERGPRRLGARLVGFNEPVDFYHLTLPDGASTRTSFRASDSRSPPRVPANGLVVVEGAEDIRLVVVAFPSAPRPRRRIYLVGAPRRPGQHVLTSSRPVRLAVCWPCVARSATSGSRSTTSEIFASCSTFLPECSPRRSGRHSPFAHRQLAEYL